MGTVRRHSRFAAWLAVVALAGNVLAAALCHPPAKPAPLDYPADLLGALVICSGTHEAADNGKPADAPTKPCQICITAAALGLVIALAIVALLFPAARRCWSAVFFAVTFARLLRRAGLSRAPPLPA